MPDDAVSTFSLSVSKFGNQKNIFLVCSCDDQVREKHESVFLFENVEFDELLETFGKFNLSLNFWATITIY